MQKAILNLFHTDSQTAFPINLSLPLLYTPCIYLHLKYLPERNMLFRKPDLLHLLPVFAFSIFEYQMVAWPGSASPFVLVQDPLSISAIYSLWQILFFASPIVYGFLIALLKKEKAEQPVQKWIAQISLMLIIFWASWFLVKPLPTSSPVRYIIALGVHGPAIFLIYVAGYQFLLEKRFLFEKYLNNRSRVNLTEAERVIARFKEIQLHRTPGITLKSASDQLEISQKQLSAATRAVSDRSFSDFVNHLRVEEFKKRVVKSGSSNLSLMGIAEECGFSSKASFHRIFKEHSNITPGQFYAQQKSQITI